MERYSEAVSAFQKGLKLSPGNTDLLVGLTRSYALLENTSEAHRLLQNLLDSSEERYLSPYQVATVYAAFREKDKT